MSGPDPGLVEKALAVKGVGADRVADPHHLTNVGDARRLVERHGENLRHVAAEERWYVWSSKGLWVPDDSGEIVRLATETVLAGHADALLEQDSDIRKTRVKHFLASEAEPQLRRMISLAATDAVVAIRPNDLDASPWFLNCENGTLDLRDQELREHRREDLITRQSPFPYDRTAKAPRWRQFLSEVFVDANGKPDEELIDFVQRGVGYSITGDTSEDAFFLPYGGGSNGKTTFIEVLRSVLGAGYAVSTPAETLLKKRNSDGPRNDVARLKGARFVTAAEPEEGRELAVSIVKAMTGGDTQVARYLFKEFFEFAPTYKIWLTTNHLPSLRETGAAIRRRIKLIPFLAVFPQSKRDEKLVERLVREEGPGILTWAIDGARAWCERGLDEPDSVLGATKQYIDDQDLIGRFLAECCKVGPGWSETVARLYDRFRSFCDDENVDAWAKRTFTTRLVERDGIARDRDGIARSIVGVRLRFDHEADEAAK